MSTNLKQIKTPPKYDQKRKAFKTKIKEKVEKDFIDSLIEENPDIPNLKKYL